jgi:hypothetical protein
MNLGQLKTLVSVWLDDLEYGYFTQAQVTMWLNNAQKECQKLLLQAGQNYYAKTVVTSTVANQNEYILPTDFFDLNRVAIVTSGSGATATQNPLTYITLNQRDMVSNQSGSPQFYNLFRNRIILFPVPNQAQSMLLTYSYLVEDMVLDSDVPDVPPEYHEFLAVLATIDGFIKDGRDMTPMMAKRAIYENMLKQASQERNLDSPRSIVITDTYSGTDAYYW